MSEVSRIDVTTHGSGQPSVTFWLRCSLETLQKAPANEEVQKAMLRENGALRPGPKKLCLPMGEALKLYNELCLRKDRGDECLQRLELNECETADDAADDAAAAAEEAV